MKPCQVHTDAMLGGSACFVVLGIASVFILTPSNLPSIDFVVTQDIQHILLHTNFNGHIQFKSVYTTHTYDVHVHVVAVISHCLCSHNTVTMAAIPLVNIESK